MFGTTDAAVSLVGITCGATSGGCGKRRTGAGCTGAGVRATYSVPFASTITVRYRGSV
jgi:hypothetical protein